MMKDGNLQSNDNFNSLCPMKPQVKYWRPTYINRIMVRNQKILQYPVKYSLLKSGDFPSIAWDAEILQAFMVVFNAYPLYKPATTVGWSGMYGKVVKFSFS